MAATEEKKLFKQIKWNQYLSNSNVLSVLQSQGKVLSFKETDGALGCLQELLKHGYSSAPLYNSDGENVGSLSVLDCVIVMTGFAKGLGFEGPLGKIQAGELNDLSSRNPYRVLDDQASTIVAIDLMAQDHVHRVVIKRSAAGGAKAKDVGRVVGFLTDSSLAAFLTDRAKKMLPDTCLRTKVRDFHRSPLKEVKKISDKAELRDAFNSLWTERVSAVAIVDDSGRLIGTLSASDLKFIDFEHLDKLRETMRQPISKLLEMKRQDSKSHAFFWASLGQVTAMLDDSIEQLLDKLSTHHVHRLWVVDGDNKPIGVVTISDLLYEIEHIDAIVTP